MSSNSPAPGPSQVEAASPPSSREGATTTATASISPITGNDTAAAIAAPESQQQQQEASRTSSPTFSNPEQTEIGASLEPVEGNTQLLVLDATPAVAPIVTVTAPTTVTVAIPVESYQPAATASATGTAILRDTKTASSPPPIEPTRVASLSVTLLLISGVRHQFTVDGAYLEQHSVKAGSGKESLTDPFEMSVWQLKECIWKDWKDEWDQRPASAMFIRLIYFGRMLEDKHPLRDCRLNQDSQNVVHMTVRPPEVGDDEMTQRSAKGGFGHPRENGNTGGTPSCRCVIL